MKDGLKKRIMYDALLFIAVYLGLLAFLLMNIDGFVFYPQRTRSYFTTPAEAKLKYDEHSVEVGGGLKLQAWHIKSPASSEVVVFYNHGNAESISMALGHAADLVAALPADVVIYDYRGYGRNEGSPSVGTFYSDAEAVFSHFAALPELRGKKFAVYGRSLGGAAAIHLAGKYGAWKLVTESTFASIPHQAWYSAGLFIFYPFTPDYLPSLKKAADVKCPWLIIHGTQDGVIDFRNSGVLLNSAGPSPKELYSVEAGHNDVCAKDPAAYYRRISEFLKK